MCLPGAFALTFSISFNPLVSSTDEETEARETTELVQGYTVSGTFETRQVKRGVPKSV